MIQNYTRGAVERARGFLGSGLGQSAAKFQASGKAARALSLAE